MKTKFWRSGAATIIAAGLLSVAAIGQTGGAAGEVKIEGNKAPAAVKAPAAPAKPAAPPTITDRDPFINQVDGGTVRGSTIRRTGSSKIGAAKAGSSVKSNKGAAAKGKDDAKEEVIVPAPEVTITGIVKSGGSHQAIVTSASGSYIISAGQKLGDYRVASITDTAVVFTNTGKSFKILIDSPFGIGAK